MKSRLQTDAALRPMLAQYVLLNLNSADPTEYGEWHQKYPHEGAGIPVVYVIRADGEKMFAKAGAITGDDLPLFLNAAMVNSGKFLSDAELTKLAKNVEAAKQAMEAEDYAKAARVLSKAPEGCYAQVAVEARSIVAQLKEMGEADLAKAKEILESNGDDIFDGAMLLSETARVFTKMPDLKRAVLTLQRDYKKSKPAAAALTQADAITKARILEDDRDKKKAEKAYQLVIAKYPDTAAANLATERIARLNGGDVEKTGTTE